MKCPYCGATAEYVHSSKVYNGRSYGMIWCCPNYPSCDSYVGVHQKTHEPLGRMANKELRRAKIQAHNVFDRLWKSGEMARGKAYYWLSQQLGVKAVHIGESDLETCQRIIEVCTQREQCKRSPESPSSE